MKLIDLLFRSRHERLFVARVMDKLRNEPESWSGISSVCYEIMPYVRYNGTDIRVEVFSGVIFAHIVPRTSSGERFECAMLVGDIIRRDMAWLVSRGYIGSDTAERYMDDRQKVMNKFKKNKK